MATSPYSSYNILFRPAASSEYEIILETKNINKLA